MRHFLFIHFLKLHKACGTAAAPLEQTTKVLTEHGRMLLGSLLTAPPPGTVQLETE